MTDTSVGGYIKTGRLRRLPREPDDRYLRWRLHQNRIHFKAIGEPRMTDTSVGGYIKTARR